MIMQHDAISFLFQLSPMSYESTVSLGSWPWCKLWEHDKWSLYPASQNEARAMPIICLAYVMFMFIFFMSFYGKNCILIPREGFDVVVDDVSYDVSCLWEGLSYALSWKQSRTPILGTRPGHVLDMSKRGVQMTILGQLKKEQVQLRLTAPGWRQWIKVTTTMTQRQG